MWWYNLGLLYKEAGDALVEFNTIQEQDVFPQINMETYTSKIVSDVHILALGPVNTPENHRNLIRDEFLSHTMANVLRISHSTLISKFQTQVWSLWYGLRSTI